MLLVALTLALTPPLDDGAGGDISSGRLAEIATASAAIATGAIAAPCAAHAAGLPAPRLLADDAAASIGFFAGTALLMLAASSNRPSTLALFAPPILAFTAFAASELVAAGPHWEPLAGGLAGLVVGSALVFVELRFSGLFAMCGDDAMLVPVLAGAPLTIGGTMAAGAALATPR